MPWTSMASPSMPLHMSVQPKARCTLTPAGSAIVFPGWGELTILINDGSGSRHEILAAAPVGVDMPKVAATIGVIDEFCKGHLDAEPALLALDAVSRLPPVSMTRFALL